MLDGRSKHEILIPYVQNTVINQTDIKMGDYCKRIGASDTVDWWNNKQTTEIFTVQNIASDVNIGYKLLNDNLSSLTGNGVELSIGNRLFGDNTLNVLNTFTANALQYYDSDYKSMNFKSAPDQSRIYINNWIANATKDKIKNMFPPNAITSGTVMVLADAIYFKGT
ncbi:SERPINB [Mytilus coruscus]|uniref:SERPINB n=1 Tax=Mytilus coruscus TaxID=42192 RepID=A0A6J8CK43_MYTCO|nr:SERPINB [Mytilus coruscus]